MLFKLEQEGRRALLHHFQIPLYRFSMLGLAALQMVSVELGKQEETLRAELRVFSSEYEKELGSFNPQRVRNFLDKRESIVEQVGRHLKSSRTAVRNARDTRAIDNFTAERILLDIEDLDAAILKERAALAKNRKKLEYTILGHPADASIGEVYLSAVCVEQVPDRVQFESLLTQAYSPAKRAPGDDARWCPISKEWHMSAAIRAVQFVPCGIGEVNASYIFDSMPEKGYELLWGYGNGLLLHANIKKALDAAQIVIVPVEESYNEFKVVVLDEGLLTQTAYVHGPRYADLHNSKLEFLSESRPAKPRLYFNCLISFFRRFRGRVQGQGMHQQKIEIGKIWKTPGHYMSEGILRAFAYEIGNIIRADEIFEGFALFNHLEYHLTDERDRRIAMEVREIVEAGETNEL